jgi:MFS family permease
VLARMLQGAGGSLNGPATFSLLADLFPRDRLPRAIAWTNLGGVLGSIGLLALGAILLLVMRVHPMHLGGLVIHNWQVVFIAVGLPGVILAPIVYLSMPEPTRRGLETAAQRKVPLIDVLKHLFGQWRLYAPMFVGLGLSSISNGGRGAWDAPFFFRTYHWSPARFALTNGLVDIPASLLGLALGVLLVERFARQGRADAPLRVVVISRLISVPVLMAMPLMPNPWLATAMLAIAQFALLLGTPSVGHAVPKRGSAGGDAQPHARPGHGAVSVHGRGGRIWRRPLARRLDGRLRLPQRSHAALVAGHHPRDPATDLDHRHRARPEAVRRGCAGAARRLRTAYCAAIASAWRRSTDTSCETPRSGMVTP